MKFFYIFSYFFIMTFTPLFATHITFINDTANTLCFSDHRTKCIMLTPQQTYIHAQPVASKLFLYTQTQEHEFTFFGLLQEKETSQYPITIYCSEILSEKIISLYPGQFILEKKDHAFMKKKTPPPAVPGSALSSQTVQSILHTLDQLPHRAHSVEDTDGTHPLAALLATRHSSPANKQKKSITQSKK